MGEISDMLEEMVTRGLSSDKENELLSAFEPARLLFRSAVCIDILKKLIEMRDGDGTYHLALADAYVQVGEMDEAARLYDEYLDDSQQPSAVVSYGDFLRIKGEYDSAAREYMRAHELFKKRFGHVIFLSDDFSDPAEERLKDILHLLSDDVRSRVLEVVKDSGEVSDKAPMSHITPPMMITSTLLKDILMEKYPEIVPVTLSDKGEDPDEISGYLDLYRDYIESNPYDVYALETTARMLSVCGMAEEAQGTFERARNIYEVSGIMIGEWPLQVQHYLQLCVRASRKARDDILSRMELWNPEDHVLIHYKDNVL